MLLVCGCIEVINHYFIYYLDLTPSCSNHNLFGALLIQVARLALIVKQPCGKSLRRIAQHLLLKSVSKLRETILVKKGREKERWCLHWCKRSLSIQWVKSLVSGGSSSPAYFSSLHPQFGSVSLLWSSGSQRVITRSLILLASPRFQEKTTRGFIACLLQYNTPLFLDPFECKKPITLGDYNDISGSIRRVC